jgi:hypothetical protein
MSTIPQEREQEQIVGVITGVVHKGEDKFQVVVQPDGSQYTKNLWTKEEGLVSTASTLIGQRLAFLCNVSHWKHQDGTPVRSLWLETFGPVTPDSPAMQGPPQNAWEAAQAAQALTMPAQPPPGTFPPTQAPLPVVPVTPTVTQPQPERLYHQGTGVPVQPDLRELKIHRQTASKVAAIMLTHVKPEDRTMSTLLVLAERLVNYYDTGLPQAPIVTLDDLITQATPRTVDEGPPPLPADDGIPC